MKVDNSTKLTSVVGTSSESDRSHKDQPPTRVSLSKKPDPRPSKDSVHFSHYSFIQCPSLFHLNQNGAANLASEGCFLLPGEDVLDNLLETYFKHVHPMLPLLNEKNFCDTYAIKAHYEPQGRKEVSLLLLQAMLFVACNVSILRAS